MTVPPTPAPSPAPSPAPAVRPQAPGPLGTAGPAAAGPVGVAKNAQAAAPSARAGTRGPLDPDLVRAYLDRPRSLSDRVANWFVQTSLIASTTSILLHVGLTLIAAVVTVGLVSGGRDRAGPEGELILTLAPAAEITEIGSAMLDTTAPSVGGDLDLPDLQVSGIMEGAGGIDAPGSGPGLGPIGEGLGGAGGGDIGDGQGLGAGGTGGGAASFFGVEAKGSRFAYICDISGSMRGNRIQALKIELRESVEALLEHMGFYIVLFNSGARELGDRSKWTVASPSGKRWAVESVFRVEANGGTEPWPAFEKVFDIKPAPDAIYFMTDGVFDPAVADLIAMRNRGSRKIPIHCITFEDKSAEELMRRIAADSGGTYSHVEGPK